MTDYTDNPYGLRRRVSSSENHVVPAKDLAALFAYAEHATLAKAHRAISLAKDYASVEHVVDAVQERMERGLASITRVRDRRTKGFVTDLDTVRTIPEDMFDSPRAVWMLGVVAGLMSVTVAAELAVVLQVEPTARLRSVRAGVAAYLDQAAVAWGRHRTELIRAFPMIQSDASSFELVMDDPEAPYYRVPVIPAAVED